ncbi:MAG: TIR domain-containing protein [Propionibacteriaceae bacterium]|jgi:tetratricopeptide (TPR) repeat protein|nr:TIR domain-containing protein [Propionibacteriaceae bacterium]
MHVSSSHWDVFLSHSSKDKDRARRLKIALEKSGVTVWFDEDQIQPGDSIPLAVEEGIEASTAVIVCLSPDFLASDWTTAERAAFTYTDPANRSRTMIPVLLRDCTVPKGLAHLKRVDYRTADREALTAIVTALDLGVGEMTPDPIQELMDQAHDQRMAGNDEQALLLLGEAECQLTDEGREGRPNPTLLSDVLKEKAMLLIRNGSRGDEEAWLAACQAVDAARSGDNPAHLVTPLLVKAQVASIAGLKDEAKAALRAAQRLDPEDTEGRVLFSQGYIARAEHNLESALHCFSEAADRATSDLETAHTPHRIASKKSVLLRCQYMVALTQAELGLKPETIATLERAARNADGNEEISLAQEVFLLQARSYLAEERWDSARTALDKAQTLAKARGDQTGVSECLELHGRARYMEGDRVGARQFIEQALMQSQSDGARIHRHLLLATIAHELGDIDGSRDHLNYADQLAEEGGDRVARADIGMQRRRLGLIGQDEAVDAEIDDLKTTRDGERDPARRIKLTLAIAARLLRPGLLDDAITEYKDAESAAQRQGLTDLVVAALIGQLAAEVNADSDVADSTVARISTVIDSVPNEEAKGLFIYHTARLRLAQHRIVEAAGLFHELQRQFANREDSDTKRMLRELEHSIEATSRQLTPSELTLEELAGEFESLRHWFSENRGAETSLGEYSPIDQLWYYWRREDVLSRFNTELGAVGIVLSSDSSVISSIQADLGWMFDLLGFVPDTLQHGGIELFTIPESLPFPYLNVRLVVVG